MSTNNSSEALNDMPELELTLSNTPTSSTDVINVAYSATGAVFMQLISVLPDGLIENHRTVLNSESVEMFIDTLCDATDYYPKKIKKPKKRAVRKKKRIPSK